MAMTDAEKAELKAAQDAAAEAQAELKAAQDAAAETQAPAVKTAKGKTKAGTVIHGPEAVIKKLK